MDATAELPDNLEALKAIALAGGEEIAALKAVNAGAEARMERLIAPQGARSARYGRRSETLDPEQHAFVFEEIEATLAAANPERAKRTPRLPRIEVAVEPDAAPCVCGSDDRVMIGEDVSERLDVVPAKFQVIVTHRPKYACKACREGVIRAPAPARLIEAGLPTEALAHVAVSN